MNELQNFLEGMGAFAETCKIFYDRLILAGFDDQRALWLTGELVKQMISSSSTYKKEEQND